jgi:hypothetical protein
VYFILTFSLFWYTDICMTYFYFKHSCNRPNAWAVYWPLISDLVTPMGSLLPRISTWDPHVSEASPFISRCVSAYPTVLVNLRFVSTPPLSLRLLHPSRLVQPATHEASIWKAFSLSSAPWSQLPLRNFQLSLWSSNKKIETRKEERKSQVNK